MKLDRSLAASLLLVPWLGLALPGHATGQLVSVKTLPVATGDQFLIFPSQNLGMAGVSIAVNDPTLDPFVNPAKGSLIDGTQIFTSPSFYSIGDDSGAGRSLPVGLLLEGDALFGGFALSLQQLESPDRFGGVVVPFRSDPTLLSEKSSNNLYAFGMLGTRLQSNLALGASLFWADLDAVEGVDLLYAGSESIEQSGHMLDLRVGLYGRLAGEREYEVLLLHNHFDMQHDVSYWEPVPVFEPPNDTVVGPIEPPWGTRLEKNLDRTNTWGLHLGYVQPLAGAGWRLGGILTGNYKSHPKIPNYEIMNIPRDPGDTWAVNLGVGVSRSAGATTFAVDLILEPIWSDTWAEAEEPITTPSGRIIPIGGKTVENDFRFSNASIRTGFGWQGETAGFQLGLAIRSIDYELEQIDHVAETKRNQDESWAEWTPGWGFGLKFSELEIRYAGRLTTGTGRPGVAWGPWAAARMDALAEAADIVAAPSGPLTLQDANVWSHQVTLTIPMRN